MLRSQDMMKVTLLGHATERENVIQRLHKIGAMQLIDLKGSDLPLKNAVSSEEVREISDLLLRVSHIISTLKLAPMKESWSQKLFGFETEKRAKVRQKEKRSVVETAERFLERHENGLLALETTHDETKERLEELKEYRAVIRLLLEHDIPVDVLAETRRIGFTVGKIALASVTPLREELERELEGRLHIETRQTDSRTAVLIIITHKDDSQRVNFIVKKFGLATFAFRKIPPADRPMEWVEERIEEAERRITEAVESIRAQQGTLLAETIFLREELEILKERFEAIHKLKESKSFFVLQGWVPRSEVAAIRRGIGDAVIVEEEPTEQEEPPTKLSNPGVLRPFEMLTELYALPKYKDLDPTFIVAPLFLIYAGFMLTDFVYGLGLVLLGIIIYLLFRKHDESMRHISISIFLIGFFSMIFGVLTGSYLGDAPSYFFGIPTADLAIWKDPLADPLYFLILSLAVGLIHLNIGLILGLIEDIRKKAWRTLVSDRAVWWLLQAAILAFVLGNGLLGKILIGVTLLTVIALQGPLGLLGMTGFMGDVISYSRLFALALSTAGIAMTVNLLADMLTTVPYVGFLLAAIIFIAGHLFSFAMNALGSFVHSIRLQFVEFFGKFYEGGGDKFTPFREERVYTEVDE